MFKNSLPTLKWKAEITDEDWAISGKAMKVRTRAFIGRNLFEPSTFYRIIGDLNETLLEAIEIRDGRFKKAKLAHKTSKQFPPLKLFEEINPIK